MGAGVAQPWAPRPDTHGASWVHQHTARETIPDPSAPLALHDRPIWEAMPALGRRAHARHLPPDSRAEHIVAMGRHGPLCGQPSVSGTWRGTPPTVASRDAGRDADTRGQRCARLWSSSSSAHPHAGHLAVPALDQPVPGLPEAHRRGTWGILGVGQPRPRPSTTHTVDGGHTTREPGEAARRTAPGLRCHGRIHAAPALEQPWPGAARSTPEASLSQQQARRGQGCCPRQVDGFSAAPTTPAAPADVGARAQLAQEALLSASARRAGQRRMRPSQAALQRRAPQCWLRRAVRWAHRSDTRLSDPRPGGVGPIQPADTRGTDAVLRPTGPHLTSPPRALRMPQTGQGAHLPTPRTTRPATLPATLHAALPATLSVAPPGHAAAGPA